MRPGAIRGARHGVEHVAVAGGIAGVGLRSAVGFLTLKWFEASKNWRQTNNHRIDWGSNWGRTTDCTIVVIVQFWECWENVWIQQCTGSHLGTWNLTSLTSSSPPQVSKKVKRTRRWQKIGGMMWHVFSIFVPLFDVLYFPNHWNKNMMCAVHGLWLSSRQAWGFWGMTIPWWKTKLSHSSIIKPAKNSIMVHKAIKCNKPPHIFWWKKPSMYGFHVGMAEPRSSINIPP